MRGVKLTPAWQPLLCSVGSLSTKHLCNTGFGILENKFLFLSVCLCVHVHACRMYICTCMF